MTNTLDIYFPLTLSEQIFGIAKVREQSRFDFEVTEQKPKAVLLAVPESRANLEDPNWEAAFDAIVSEQRLSA